MRKAGIKEIAARAGVSIATVSHAFRNPARVSDATRKKVLEAADAIGYTPNRLAVSLRTARSGNIVVIIPDISASHNSKIIRAIERIAREHGYSVLLGDTQGSPEREREFATMTRSRQADGIILMSQRLPFDPEREDLPPLVNGCEYTGNPDIPFVSVDDEKAAFDATGHLLALGHRRIAAVTGHMESTSSRRRLRGFQNALKSAGLECPEERVFFGSYAIEDGQPAAAHILGLEQRPTAIFCFSDEMALGCIHELKQNGVDVPGDMSVIGFDNIPIAQYCSPTLTTIAQPTDRIGSTCARLLFDLIQGKYPEEPISVLPHELLVRESTRQLEN